MKTCLNMTLFLSNILMMLINSQIELIRDQIKNIVIAPYDHPSELGLDICDLKSSRLDSKTIQTTVSLFDTQLTELNEKEKSALKGVVFASSAVYVSFTFEVHTSISSYSLSYSQFVGAAKREGENISVIYIRSKVTGLLFFQVGLKTYCPPGRPNSCPACVNSISTYCEYGNETSFYFPPYDEPQRMLCPFDPRPQDLISIAGFLKEYTKNELLKYQQIQILNFLQ